MKKLLLIIMMVTLVLAGCQSPTEAPKAAENLTVNTEATYDLGTMSETNLYTNNHLNFQMQFPEDFNVAISDHINALFGTAITADMDLTTLPLVPLAFVSKLPLEDQSQAVNQNMTMTVEQVMDANDRVVTVEEYLTLAKANLTTNLNASIGDFEKVTINDVPFMRFKNNMTINGIDIVQYQYTTKIDNYFVSIALTDDNTEEVMPTLIKSVESFKGLK